MRKCTKCGEIKPIDEFGKYKRKSGFISTWGQCKLCRRLYYQDGTQEYKNRIMEKSKQWKENNKGKVSLGNKKWRTNNLEHHKELILNWVKLNPEKKKSTDKKAFLKKYQTPKGKLNICMRNATRRYLQGNRRNRTWELLVGYTLYDLQSHLEEQFTEGMSWANYGDWHIDHKTPLAVHNFETTEDLDFKRAWNLKNLQPMWAVENKRKGSRLEMPFQPSLSL